MPQHICSFSECAVSQKPAEGWRWVCRRHSLRGPSVANQGLEDGAMHGQRGICAEQGRGGDGSLGLEG